MYVRGMPEAVVVEELVAMPPGPELAAALGTADLSRLTGAGLVHVLRAQSRQCAHEQARLWASLVEVGLAVPPDELADGSSNSQAIRAAEVATWASGEVAAALTWTSRTADRELDLAQVVVRALPEVFAALWAGEIDRGKAAVFAGYLDPACGVTPEQAAVICTRLLPVAPKLTTAQLRGRLWRAVLAIDPGWARRRYTRAVRGRAVTAVLADDGTVTITGSSLPADKAAVACARVDRLAEAAKRAGHPGRVGQIAADVYLGLLDGRFHGLSEEQIIAELSRELRPEDTGPDNAPDDEASDRRASGDHASDAPASEGHTSDDHATDPARDDGIDESTEVRPAAGHARTRVTTPTGVEIRVGLATLLGLDERPGEIPGLGPVLPAVARDLVTHQQRGAEWRFAVTGSDGHLLLAGMTRCRPRRAHVTEQTTGRCSGGIVELQIEATRLTELVELIGDRAADHAAPRWTTSWAAVIADIAAQFAARHTLLAALDDRPLDRFPGAALARHVQVRDRTCSHPGCRRPARRCDLDHTRDHASGGQTVRANLGPGCDRHHPLKHGLGWRLAQPRPGFFEWTSPLRQVYRTRGEPILAPLPDPQPRPPECDNDHYGRMWIEGPILRLPDPPTPGGARPPPAPTDPNDSAPF